MAVVEIATLSRDEARSLTDEIKGDAERLWRKLVELYEGRAHIALGYSSWATYFSAEFGGNSRRSYQLLQAGRVMRTLEPVQHVALPRTDRVARELVPLQSDPEKMREAWVEVTATHANPTSAQVHAVVQTKVGILGRKAEINAEAAKRKLYDALSTVSGYSAALADFDVARLATATREDLDAWDRFATEAIRALRALRQNIKEVS